MTERHPLIKFKSSEQNTEHKSMIQNVLCILRDSS